MRRQGLVDSPREVGLDGHACWSYHDLAADFRDAAAAFLDEGLALGQHLMFVGGPDAEEVVRSVDPMGSMVTDGSLAVVPFETVYPSGARMPDAAQWASYREATERARQRGFTGLRVLAEVTALAAPDGAWAHQAHWETFADRRMAGFPLAALCCFDRNAVPPEGLATIASAHPVVDRRLRELVPFRLFGQGDSLALVGEVDAFSSGVLRHLLRVDDATAGQVLDLHDLRFFDHTGLRVLHEYAEGCRARGLDVTVRGGPPSLRRLTELLGVML